MSDIGSDWDAAVDLVVKAEDRLLVKSPDHQLIAYLRITDNRKQEVAWQKQLRSFSKTPEQEGNVRGAMEVTYAMARYLLALEVALGERTEREVSANQPIYTKSSLDDEIPF